MIPDERVARCVGIMSAVREWDDTITFDGVECDGDAALCTTSAHDFINLAPPLSQHMD